METADFPLRWVINSARPYHVQVDVHEASNQVVISAHRSCEVAVFPKRSLSGFSLVIFLSRPSRDQLHAPGNLCSPCISNQQMNMIAGSHVVQHAQTVSFGRLEQPVFPAQAVAFKLKQKLPTMTPMGDMPYGTRNIKPIGSGHELRSLT